MADIQKRRADRWNFLFIAGMWFQDLFNYDFRRTEQCIIPYATQEGEISFCAYNTGVGWRNIIEKMHMTATLTKWYEEKGRHEIFAGNKSVPLASKDHNLVLVEEHVKADRQHDLDAKGIAKTAREEKTRARDEALKKKIEDEKMARLYREHVLGEKKSEGFVPLDGLLGFEQSSLLTVEKRKKSARWATNTRSEAWRITKARWLAAGLFVLLQRESYSMSRGRFLRLRLRARASFVRRFSPGFR